VSNVVALRPEPSVSEALWNAAPSPMRERSSRTEVEKAVRAIKKEIAASELLSAFHRYLAEDGDVRRWRAGTNSAGPPGLHRWIRNRRFEAWLTSSVNPTDHASTSRIGQQSEQENALRDRLVQALGEGFVRSYIDPYELVDGVLIVPEGKLTARARLLENREALRACGLKSMRATCEPK